MFASVRRRALRGRIAAPLTLLLLLLTPILTLGGGALSVYGLSTMNNRVTIVRNVWLPSVGILGHLQATVEQFRTAQQWYAMTDPIGRRQLGGEVLQHLQDVEQARATYETYIALNTEDEKFMREYDQAWSVYRQFNQRLVDGQLTLSDFLEKDVSTSFERIRAAVQKDLSFNLAMGLKAADESRTIYELTKWLMIGLTFITTIICLLLCYKISPHTYVRSKKQL